MTDVNDFDQVPRDAAIRDRAMEWYRKMEPEILALAGREATASEQAIAQMMIVGEMGAKMYGSLRKDFDARTAQDVLKTTFNVIGGIMRRNGESVQMNVSIEFSDVAAPQGLKPIGQIDKDKPCECQLDVDGRCLPCIELLRGFCQKMGESTRIMQEAQLGPKACRACLRRHIDGAIAEFVRKELPQMGPEISEALMKTLLFTSQTLQAQAMPLTMKAWDEIQKRGAS